MDAPLAYGESGLVEVGMITALIQSLPKPMIKTLSDLPDGITLAADFLPAIQRLTIEMEDTEAEQVITQIIKGDLHAGQFPYRYASHLLDMTRVAMAFFRTDRAERMQP